MGKAESFDPNAARQRERSEPAASVGALSCRGLAVLTTTAKGASDGASATRHEQIQINASQFAPLEWRIIKSRIAAVPWSHERALPYASTFLGTIVVQSTQTPLRPLRNSRVSGNAGSLRVRTNGRSGK
jgi:hypothetical protein